MYMSIMDNVMGGDLFEDVAFSIGEIYSEFFRYHIRGIASEKGLNQLMKLKQTNENL